MMRWSLILLLSVTTGFNTSCGSDPTPEEPEGGYYAFRNALLSGNTAALWETVTDDTHTLFEDALNDLRAIQESLELLSPSDRAIAYERTGVILLASADSAERLFDALVRLENLVGDESYRLGSEVEELSVTATGERATVTTRAGQTFELESEDDGIWRVSSMSRIARERLRHISDNLMAVEVMVAESAYRRRSHEQIERLLRGE